MSRSHWATAGGIPHGAGPADTTDRGPIMARRRFVALTAFTSASVILASPQATAASPGEAAPSDDDAPI